MFGARSGWSSRAPESTICDRDAGALGELPGAGEVEEAAWCERPLLAQQRVAALCPPPSRRQPAPGRAGPPPRRASTAREVGELGDPEGDRAVSRFIANPLRSCAGESFSGCAPIVLATRPPAWTCPGR